jgi:uncharacterized protein YkuJ
MINKECKKMRKYRIIHRIVWDDNDKTNWAFCHDDTTYDKYSADDQIIRLTAKNEIDGLEYDKIDMATLL